MLEIYEEHQSLIIGIITAFFISLLLTGLIIPKLLLIAYRKNLLDVPDERKIHKGAIPRLGGIAFVPALIFSVCIVWGIFNFPQYSSIDEMVVSSSTVRAVCFSVCGLLILYLVGIADDLVGVLYRAKFVIQLLAAILLICGGLYIRNLEGFFGIYEWPDICGCMLTLLVTVFFVNAINLIDGIDGLASGLSAVAMAFYGVMFAIGGDTLNAMIAFATLGTLLQFFYYNVFGNARMGKKIFMGDTGALCIGFILTYLSVSICDEPTLINSGYNPLVVAFSPMIVPCFDVLRVFFGRIKAGKSPFMPDKTHIHHKLLRLGMPAPRAMGAILALSGIFVISNVLLSPYINSALLIMLDLVAWTVYHYRLSSRIKRHEAAIAASDPQ
ncbi:MAG: undecaprenyl/decaprenyl-phosphate alpha-N-acetylglucosaminyl 1-phosphate transferase [Muribaculaceae bacterium]|nr:undecaprenyl/decaprenyl-phosphate alpha-N-acetylglucosaminyl 1-phosphate transferase [Muribaculaceae bacterium]